MRAVPDRQAASIEFLSRAGRIPLPLPSLQVPPPRQGGEAARDQQASIADIAQGLHLFFHQFHGGVP